jgi:hypothetical protein
MSHSTRPAAKPVGELIAKSLEPIVRKRGFARAELLAWWPDIVGAAYASATTPERIRWTRDGSAATLIVRCDPSLALQFQHEVDRVRERLNGYFGYPAVGAVRIVQKPLRERPDERKQVQSGREVAGRIKDRLDRVEGPLAESLKALARGILARS